MPLAVLSKVMRFTASHLDAALKRYHNAVRKGHVANTGTKLTKVSGSQYTRRECQADPRKQLNSNKRFSPRLCWETFVRWSVRTELLWSEISYTRTNAML